MTRDPTPDSTPPSRMRKSVTSTTDSLTPKNASATSPSRFALLTSSMSATLSRLTQPTTSPATSMDDEILNLNIEAALFPSGSPTDRDVFSPAAFKNLQANATGLLLRMQNAYRQRVVTLGDLTAENGARNEELEEAETRAHHLKMQLEGMARKAADQEREMKALMDELAAEKKARAHYERMMRDRALAAGTISLDTHGDEPSQQPQLHTIVVPPMSEGGSMISEDLGVDEEEEEAERRLRRQKNKWRKSLKSDGSSYDTDEDSAEDESVFSRSRSPTNVLTGGGPGMSSFEGISPVGVTAEPFTSPAPHHPRVVALGQQLPTMKTLPSRPPATQPSAGPSAMNAFQKLVKNVITSTTTAREDREPGTAEYGFGYDGSAATTCPNCRGQDVSFAWNTVSLLRDENRHLKQRVGQLETAVDGALDMVNGVGLDLLP